MTRFFSRNTTVRSALALALGTATSLCAGCPKQDSKSVTPVAQQTPETKKQDTPPTKPAEVKPPETKPPETKPQETKPTDTKPAESKPNDAKPADPKPDPKVDPKVDPPKPSVDPWPAPANKPLPTMDVKLGDKTFKLEKAFDNVTRFGGLSGRKEIADTGGMIFAFRTPAKQSFVMRDCPVAIDIIYVDATSRIDSMYHMLPEPPRTEKEKVQPGHGVNQAYEERLKKYPSRFAAAIVIELKANTLDIAGENPGGIKLKVGDKLDLDVSKLRQEALP